MLVEHTSITDVEAPLGLKTLTRLEGALPALKSAHAIAYLLKAAPDQPKDNIIIVGLSGCGDKDLPTVMKAFGLSHHSFPNFSCRLICPVRWRAQLRT